MVNAACAVNSVDSTGQLKFELAGQRLNKQTTDTAAELHPNSWEQIFHCAKNNQVSSLIPHNLSSCNTDCNRKIAGKLEHVKVAGSKCRCPTGSETPSVSNRPWASYI